MLFEGALGFIRITGNFLITLLFMKGEFFEKVLVSIMMDTALLLISYISINVLSVIFNVGLLVIASEFGFIRLI